MGNHPEFGKQLAVVSWERPMPQTIEQVTAFLASPLVKGCGVKQAGLIAEQLGEEALAIISQQGVRSLEGIKGIGEKRANAIVESVRSTFEVQKIIGELLVYGITASMAMRLYKEYESNTVAIVTENPYKLTELNLIGFLKADEIARKMGYPLVRISHRRLCELCLERDMFKFRSLLCSGGRVTSRSRTCIEP